MIFHKMSPRTHHNYVYQNHCQRFDVIQAEPPGLLPTQEYEMRLCSHGAHFIAHQRNWERKATLGKDLSGHLMYHDLSDLESLILIQTISKGCSLSDRQEREGFFKTFRSSRVPPRFWKWHKSYKKKINKDVAKGQQTGNCPRLLSEETKRKMERSTKKTFPAYYSIYIYPITSNRSDSPN